MFQWLKKLLKKNVEKLETVAQPSEELKAEVVAAEVEEVLSEEAPALDVEESYEVKKHPNGGWQVKAVNASEPVQCTKTQKEAIEFASSAKFNFVVYKVDGTLKE